MSTLAEKIKSSRITPYQQIAIEFNTSEDYVGQIARGDRIPIRGKGLKIQKRLNELFNPVEK